MYKRQEQQRELSRKDRKEVKRQEKRLARKKRARNKEFARVTYLFVALFIAMMGYMAYFNVAESQEVIRSPYNKRQDSFADRVIRGKILDHSGNVLVQTSVAEDGSETREYPYGNMFAHVVGLSLIHI